MKHIMYYCLMIFNKGIIIYHTMTGITVAAPPPYFLMQNSLDEYNKTVVAVF